MINARSESAAIKPAFRDALKLRRCLVPADAFYEWSRAEKTKQPYCFEVNHGELFAFAGLWERWNDPSGNWIKSCDSDHDAECGHRSSSRPNAGDTSPGL
jgi:putative SOS response-associated peptidase YedK